MRGLPQLLAGVPPRVVEPPGSYDWWVHLGVPSLAAIAATLLAFAAWATARRSSRIADEAFRAERARDKAAYEREIDNRLADLAVACLDYAGAVEQWQEALRAPDGPQAPRPSSG